MYLHDRPNAHPGAGSRDVWLCGGECCAGILARAARAEPGLPVVVKTGRRDRVRITAAAFVAAGFDVAAVLTSRGCDPDDGVLEVLVAAS